jgi:hypothetical protein
VELYLHFCTCLIVRRDNCTFFVAALLYSKMKQAIKRQYNAIKMNTTFSCNE